PQLAPLQRRQVGNLQCNIARLQTVSGLVATQKAVNEMASAAGRQVLGSDDATTASAVSDAQAGLSSAQAGIATIAKAIVSGQNAPAAARGQVGDGLTQAKSALESITSTDSAVTSALQDAQTKLDGTISAGEQVVSDCGGDAGTAAGKCPNSKSSLKIMRINDRSRHSPPTSSNW
ncbi:hypothetical protein K435DRAFT_662040, partial [Dendrothele bispora CBS 962.96]